ncbi:MAG: FKBP-type peptidyl-prolyl cis-trans isomerase [Bacteroidales bacterium]|nr:FKBP-type peptidyl-prolyl cis-trans isomerase [Bacteroidales bacterium]
MAQKNTPSYPLKTFIDSASYAIGRDIYNTWEQQNLGLNYEVVAHSLLDCVSGVNNWGDDELRMLLMRFQQSFEKKQKASVQENIDKGKEFMKKNALDKSVKTTESGLQYKVVKTGNGKKPKADDVVKVHYTGKLISGQVFDSSEERGEPISFPLNQVIPGWSEGVQLMDEGSTYILYIPYHLAYGEQQAGMIPPGSTIIFEVQLLEIMSDSKSEMINY